MIAEISPGLRAMMGRGALPERVVVIARAGFDLPAGTVLEWSDSVVGYCVQGRDRVAPAFFVRANFGRIFGAGADFEVAI